MSPRLNAPLFPRLHPWFLLALCLAAGVMMPVSGFAQGTAEAPEDAASSATDPALLAPGAGAAQAPQREVAKGDIVMTIEFPLGTLRAGSVNHAVATLENAGPDFIGSLVLSTTSWVPPTQYFQEVTLPSGTSKRFVFNAFEGEAPAYELFLLDRNSNLVLKEEVSAEVSGSGDIQVLQVGGHPSDFAALQGNNLQVRAGIAELLPDPGAIKNNMGLSARQTQEPIIPLMSFRQLAPERMPTGMIDIQNLTLICIDLGQWSRLSPAQRELLTNYARFGGHLLFYPALDYGYPTEALEQPLLPTPLQAGFTLPTGEELRAMEQLFGGWTPDADRPLRFLSPTLPASQIALLPRLELPSGRPLLLTAREGFGKVALLLFQPAQLVSGAGADRNLRQMLDRSGLLEATLVQWYGDRRGSLNLPNSPGIPQFARTQNIAWRPASPRMNFWVQNFSNAINPAATQPFKGGQSSIRFYAVPLAFLRQEGVKLLLWMLILVGLSQVILATRRKLPMIWMVLPAASFLFALTLSPATVNLPTPYQYEEWDILRFPGEGAMAYLATTSWLANLSRHGTEQSLGFPEQADWFFDEFVYSGSPMGYAYGNINESFSTVRYRQGANPGLVELAPEGVGRPRLFLGWGPVATPGQLHGKLTVSGPDAEVLTLSLTNDTPWRFHGGLIYLENEYLFLQGATVPAVEPGATIEVPIEGESVIRRLDIARTRPTPTPFFDVPLPVTTPQPMNWAHYQSEVLYEEDRLQQTLMFTKPSPEFAFVPTHALVVGSLEGYSSGLQLDGKTPAGNRVTLATCPVPIIWNTPARPVQPPFEWNYYDAALLPVADGSRR